MLLLFILWNDWPVFMISGSNEQLQQQLEYTLLKPDSHSRWISKMQSDILEERWKLWPRDEEIEFPVEACWLSQTQEGQTEQIHPQTFDDPFFSQHWHHLQALGSHWTVNKECYLEVLREFRKRFRRKRPALFRSAQWHFHQDNAPVHNSVFVTDYLTKMGIKTVPQPP